MSYFYFTVFWLISFFSSLFADTLTLKSGNKVSGKVIQKDLEKFAFLTEDASKKVSPVDTGHMMRSIFTDVGKLTASVGPHVFYAPFVHEGTRKMAARPFLKWGLKTASRKLWGSAKPPFAWGIENEFKKEFAKL